MIPTCFLNVCYVCARTSLSWYKAMTCCKLYVVMLLVCITGLGVGIAVGIVTSSLAFGIAIITVRIIAKCRMKGNYVLVQEYLEEEEQLVTVSQILA